MKAIDIFSDLIDRALWWSYNKRWSGNHGKPGELIEKLDPEKRQQLKNLTSDESIDILSSPL